MNYLSTIVLYVLQIFKGERTIYGIYHLLTGKKSAQTIQDAKLYRISHLFQSFSYLKKEAFTQYVQELKEKAYIKEQEQGIWILTEAGKRHLQDQLQKFPLSPHLEGWRYMNISASFLLRLTLLIQTISHLVYHDPRFLPVTKDLKVQNWLKHFLKRQDVSRDELARQLFHELCTCLKQCESVEADMFLLQFSGFQRAGLTKTQIGERYEVDEHRVHYIQMSVLHFCLNQIISNPSAYRLLSTFISKEDTSMPVTVSTMKTVHLLKKGKTIDEVMAIRGLKKSTIEDHLVEIASMIPSFPIEDYVPEPLQSRIVSVLEELKTNKLKEIKESLGEEATYFQIRIVMAKYFS